VNEQSKQFNKSKSKSKTKQAKSKTMRSTEGEKQA
jgi:hypothetical protein